MTTELLLLGTAGAPMPHRSASTGRRDPKRYPKAMPPSTGRPRSTQNCLPPARRTWSRTSLAGYAYHLNVMPLDARMPDAGALVRAIDVPVPGRTESVTQSPVAVFEDGVVRVTAVAVTHGRAVPALAYRFDTADGSVVFSGDTTVNDDLIALAQGADILVHHVADLGYLERHGMTGAALQRMAALHTDVTEVGGVAERARVRELILSHYLPAELDAITDAEWAERAGQGFTGRTTSGRDGLRRTLPLSAS
jgi:ribonuclease BN (tRNA processing enzyme)